MIMRFLDESEDKPEQHYYSYHNRWMDGWSTPGCSPIDTLSGI